MDQEELIQDVNALRSRITVPVTEIKEYCTSDLKSLEIGFDVDDDFREMTDHCLKELSDFINTLSELKCISPAVWNDKQQSEHCDGLWVRRTIGPEQVLYSIYVHKKDK